MIDKTFLVFVLVQQDLINSRYEFFNPNPLYLMIYTYALENERWFVDQPVTETI